MGSTIIKVRMPTQDLRTLERLARSSGLTKSAVVREAVRNLARRDDRTAAVRDLLKFSTGRPPAKLKISLR